MLFSEDHFSNSPYSIGQFHRGGKLANLIKVEHFAVERLDRVKLLALLFR